MTTSKQEDDSAEATLLTPPPHPAARAKSPKEPQAGFWPRSRGEAATANSPRTVSGNSQQTKQDRHGTVSTKTQVRNKQSLNNKGVV